MIINHNMNAMNAHRLMTGNTAMAGKSMEKLSSGLRINRAGDDAAGLAISEKMRAQIRGLDQASRNAQDGVSLIQTAEGALNETHSILQRMRELATQAANDTNVTVDRKEIQKEMNQLTSEVNRIGNTTEFNTKKLLSSGVSSNDRENIVKGLKKGWLEMAEKRIEDYYGLTGKGTTALKVTLSANGAYGELAHVGGNSAELELNIDVDDFKPGTGEDGDNIHKEDKLFNDRIIAHEMTHAIMDDALGVSKMNSMPTWFKEGTAEFMAGADERLKKVIGDGTKAVASKVTTLKDEVVRLLNGGDKEWNSQSNSDLKYSAGYVAVKYLSSKLNTPNDMKGLMKVIKDHTGTDGKAALEAAIKSNSGLNGISDLVNDFKANGETFINGLSLQYGTDEGDVGAIGGSSTGKGAIKAEDVLGNGSGVKENPLKHFTKVTWPEEDSSEVKLQIGANEGQSLTIELKDMRAGALKISGSSVGGTVTSKDGTVTAKYAKVKEVNNGTDNQSAEYALDVSTHDNASAAIKIVNDAIENVSSFRSELGAYQNRLEHTINNLNNSSENLTASESRVRDVDMAKEMMTFSKKNILSQAAQAMLAQANQQPQGVLQLLR